MKLIEIITWLKKSPKHGLEIVNLATASIITKNLTATDLEAFSKWEDYFLQLAQKGVKKIQVQRTRKQGASNIREDIVPKQFEIGTTPESVVESGGQSDNGPATLPHQNTYAPTHQPTPAMGNPQMQGLTGEQFVKAYNHDNLKNEVIELKRKNETLESENKRLDRENMKYALGIEGKPGALEKLMENLTPETIAMVAQAIASAKAGGGAGQQPALNAPDLGRYKSELISLISSDKVSEGQAQSLIGILYKSSDKEFIQQLNNLLNNGNGDS
ncbi:hypothetical protein LX95_01298 [Mesonia algae]|uniref:Uncharacterized protein n=1 Tax=Mesonia algae TaxID=213248 RepID=A0A2W7IQB2_9FLAO|nr:hypothetical protein [Mesonia algae]PZW41617.1 hypothetical protein LX95_01298 [Mesonia algae]